VAWLPQDEQGWQAVMVDWGRCFLYSVTVLPKKNSIFDQTGKLDGLD
jgi:hypothetical protein